MKISACTQVPMNADSELIENIEKIKFQKLMEEAVSKMEPGHWYAIRLDRQASPQFGGDGMVLKSSLTVTPASEKTAVYISPEDMFLKNNVQVSFWEKIKNCIKYLRDKSGGEIKWKGKDDE